VERAGHLLLWDEPEHLAARIGEFLDASRSTHAGGRLAS
jgi:hypothetical protein